MRSVFILFAFFAVVALAKDADPAPAPVPSAQPTDLVDIAALPESVVKVVNFHIATVYGETANITKASRHQVVFALGTIFVLEVVAHSKYFAADDTFNVTVFEPHPIGHLDIPFVIKVELISGVSEGFKPTSRLDLHVLAAAEFALIESKQYMALPHVLEARVQLTAGVKYELAIQLPGSKVLKAVVVKPVNGSLQLYDFAIQSAVATQAVQSDIAEPPLVIDISELPESVVKLVNSHFESSYGEVVTITKATRLAGEFGANFVLEVTARGKYFATSDKFIVTVIKSRFLIRVVRQYIISNIQFVNGPLGGFNPISRENEQVLLAAQFALRESKESGTIIVLEARAQVTAGTKFKLVIQVGDSKLLKAVVFKPVHGEQQLVEFTVEAL